MSLPVWWDAATASHEITTACIDNLNFKHPAFLNDTVVLVGRVT